MKKFLLFSFISIPFGFFPQTFKVNQTEDRKNGPGIKVKPRALSMPSCQLVPNSLVPGGPDDFVYYESIGSIQQNASFWTIEAMASSGISLKLSFTKKPPSKVYTIGNLDSIAGQLSVTLTTRSGSYPLDNGCKVYVTESSPNVYDIIICEGTWRSSPNGKQNELITRFSAPKQ